MKFQGITISKKISTLLVIILCTSCSTSKRLNKKIIKSLRLQNRLITKVEKHRRSNLIVKETEKSKELRESERSLLMTLESVRDSNKAVIEKLTQKSKEGEYRNER